MTSRDFAYSWRGAILPDSAADYSALFFAIRGAKPFHERPNAAIPSFTAAPGDPAALWADTVADFERSVAIETPDGRTLVVGESFGGRLTAFDVAGDGSLSLPAVSTVVAR